jgi:hypothetical protein
MNQLQKILSSGLQFSVIDGKLKIKGDAATIEALRPELSEYKPEIIAAIQNNCLPDQPDRSEKQRDGLNLVSTEMNAAQASFERVTQEQVTEIIQAAVILAEQLKADRRAADLEELDKAFNTVMFAERSGDESSFAYALMELEALVIEYSHAEEKAVA